MLDPNSVTVTRQPSLDSIILNHHARNAFQPNKESVATHQLQTGSMQKEMSILVTESFGYR